MVTAFFIGTTIISLVGCLFHWIGSAALAKYMIDKGYKPPSDEEMKACCVYVIKENITYSLRHLS